MTAGAVFLWNYKMSDQVKWFSSENKNAPSLDNTWGSLLNVIKFCLIEGYGSQTVSSISVSDGVGVATFPTSHGLQIFQYIKIENATNNSLNQEFKILGLTTNTIEFLIDLPDQMIYEPMICSLAPLGWSMPFNDEGRAVFQAKNTEKNPYFLRVDDTCDPLHTPTRAKFAKVGILETCTSIDDIGGPQAPFDPLLPTKNWIGTGSAVGNTGAYVGWAKWVYATSDTASSSSFPLSNIAIDGVRDWILVGDDANFYIFPTTLPNDRNTTYVGYSVCLGFGIFDDTDCPFLSARFDYNPINNADTSGANYAFSGQNNGYPILLKNKDGSYITGARVNDNELRLNYGLNSDGFTGYSNRYQPDPLRGVYHNPFYARDALNNFLGAFPIVRCVLNATATNKPPTVVYSEDGRAYVERKHMSSSTRHGSMIIDLGEII